MPEFVVEFGKDTPPAEPDGRLDAPAFHRNHGPIWSVVGDFLSGRTGDVLELGSGTGQHAVTFARAAPDIVWWPSDCNDAHLRSIEAWRRHAGLANLRPPLAIDLSAADWALRLAAPSLPERFLAVLCINVLHIAPWQVAQGLFAGVGRRIAADGRLFVYGPFMRDGAHTADSNATFDASLRRSNPEWGVRDVVDIEGLAGRMNLRLAETVPMPANNMVLVFARSAS